MSQAFEKQSFRIAYVLEHLGKNNDVEGSGNQVRNCRLQEPSIRHRERQSLCVLDRGPVQINSSDVETAASERYRDQRAVSAAHIEHANRTGRPALVLGRYRISYKAEAFGVTPRVFF